MFQRILVAVDASPARHSAVRMAGEMARLTGGKVSVLHVVASAATLAAVVPLEDDSEATTVLDEAVAVLRAAGVDAEGRIADALTTQTATTIAAAAEEFEADLLVLSPHRHGWLETLVNPRVSDTVAHIGRTAVLLAPHDEAAGRS
ncbi:universal stress protein [Streptomyces ziwulingensis]|uniref:Universal stress protein n=1 Tax=Streptomyces ziwulingensis TaxID=1045501 RepID=A0ABP9CL44_9ACTN